MHFVLVTLQHCSSFSDKSWFSLPLVNQAILSQGGLHFVSDHEKTFSDFKQTKKKALIL